MLAADEIACVQKPVKLECRKYIYEFSCVLHQRFYVGEREEKIESK